MCVCVKIADIAMYIRIRTHMAYLAEVHPHPQNALPGIHLPMPSKSGQSVTKIQNTT